MKINNPAVTPMMARGTVNQMISGCRKALNRKIIQYGFTYPSNRLYNLRSACAVRCSDILFS